MPIPTQQLQVHLDSRRATKRSDGKYVWDLAAPVQKPNDNYVMHTRMGCLSLNCKNVKKDIGKLVLFVRYGQWDGSRADLTVSPFLESDRQFKTKMDFFTASQNYEAANGTNTVAVTDMLEIDLGLQSLQDLTGVNDIVKVINASLSARTAQLIGSPLGYSIVDEIQCQSFEKGNELCLTFNLTNKAAPAANDYVIVQAAVMTKNDYVELFENSEGVIIRPDASRVLAYPGAQQGLIYTSASLHTSDGVTPNTGFLQKWGNVVRAPSHYYVVRSNLRSPDIDPLTLSNLNTLAVVPSLHDLRDEYINYIGPTQGDRWLTIPNSVVDKLIIELATDDGLVFMPTTDFYMRIDFEFVQPEPTDPRMPMQRIFDNVSAAPRDSASYRRFAEEASIGFRNVEQLESAQRERRPYATRM